MTETPMNKTATRARDPQPDFALELTRSTARGLFDKEWDGYVAMEHEPDDDEDEDDDVIANLSDDVVRPPSKRSWEAPETPLANTMTEAEIAAAISSGCDPWAQSRTGQGRMLCKGHPPASLIATALGLSVVVDSGDHLRGLFAPGHVTNLICPAACLWGLAQILPGAVKQWKSHLSSPKTADLHRYVQDEEETGRPKSRMRKRGMGTDRAQSCSRGFGFDRHHGPRAA